MCNPNCAGCGTCGSGAGGVGCSSAYFGKCGHSLLRTLLGLLVISVIFCMGFRLGTIVGMVNSSSKVMHYGMYENKGMMSDATKVAPVKAEVKK